MGLKVFFNQYKQVNTGTDLVAVTEDASVFEDGTLLPGTLTVIHSMTSESTPDTIRGALFDAWVDQFNVTQDRSDAATATPVWNAGAGSSNG